MTFCSISDVKRVIGFSSLTSPIPDADITEFILDSEEEIEDIYKTHFGNIEESGTADGDFSTTTFSDSGLSMTTDEFVGYVVWIFAGTNAGDYREITSNTATKVTVTEAFTAATDGTSQYRITKLGYADDTVDGNGTDQIFTIKQPLIDLSSLTIDSTSVTTSNVFQESSGRLTLAADAEVRFFTDTTKQQVNMTYAFGLYPIPRIIKRLCAVIAGIRTLTAQAGGTFNDFTTVSLPGGFSGGKGEPVQNIVKTIAGLQAEAKGIIYGDTSEALGSDFRRQPSFRVYTNFG